MKTMNTGGIFVRQLLYQEFFGQCGTPVGDAIHAWEISTSAQSGIDALERARVLLKGTPSDRPEIRAAIQALIVEKKQWLEKESVA